METLILPIPIDPFLLHSDYLNCMGQQWSNHFNPRDYSGKWTGISLRSLSGRIDDASSIPGGQYRNTALMEQCPYIASLLTGFNCDLESVRLLRLAAGSQILEHRDNLAGYEDGFLRLHIPIVTNPDVFFFINHVRVIMQPGECWYGNFNLPHSVRNEGTTDRIHLVVDACRNSWTDALMQQAGYKIAEVNKRNYSTEEQLRIIEELTLLGTPEALLEELKKQITS